MTRFRQVIPMSDGPWYRSTPVWGSGGAPVAVPSPGPGMQGPDNSRPEPAQPGEAPDLLPSFPGTQTERASENRQAIKQGVYPRGDRRQAPYLVSAQPIVFSATASANMVSLGKPSSGFRWIIRQLALIPGDTINSGGGQGETCHFYIGEMPVPGAFPALTDWCWALATSATNVPPVTSTFSSNILQVQSNQNLVAYLSGSTAGFTSIILARYLLIPDTAEKMVTSV